MVNESNKIIVKVGKKSRIQFANSKVYRAITANDLKVLTTNHDDCQIIVIENISEDEQEAIRDFAKDFKGRRENNSVLFYIPDNDDITSGIADELDYNIYLTDSDVYKYIYNTYGINVSIYLADRKRLNSEELSESIPEGITDIFGDIGEDAESDISETIAAIDEADSKAEENIESEDTTDNNIDGVTDIFGNIDNVSLSGESVDEKTDTLENEVTETPVESSKAKEVKESKKESKAKHKEKESKALENEENKASINDNKAEDSLEVNTEEMSSDTAEIIEDLKMQVRDAKYDYSVVLKDMREANKRITSLEDIIRLLKEEKEEMQKRFDELVVSDEVLEDPITLSEYGGIKENAEKLESQVIDLKSTIGSLKEAIEAKELDINSSETTIDDLRETVDSLKKQLDDLHESIDSGEAFRDKEEEYIEKVKQATDEKDKAVNRLSDVEEENSQLQENVNELTLRSETEAETRLSLLEQLRTAILKIKDLSNNVNSIKNENNELLNKLNETSKQLQDSKDNSKEQLNTIAKLEKSLNDSDKRIELANNYSLSETNQLKSKISQLETKLQVTEQQLQQKENQYNTLVQTSGIDENGANALIQTNKTLESVSQTLREQLGTANIELNKAKRNESEALRQMAVYKAQVESLQNSFGNIASSGGGVQTDVRVDAIRNMCSKSQIITVFGSGSFGITTTAMSLANKLSATSKVLYVDFDLVSPMADAWFKKNPMATNIPGTMNGSIQNSGLGLFVEHGIGIISQYLNNIVKLATQTKGGGLYYFSGLYYKPDPYKLASADYGELFNLFGDNFQYIVIDFGRLGSSDLGDQLIKAVSDIAFRNIVVTTMNFFELRNFKTKLGNANINLDSVAWLLNMCTTTAVDDKTKKIVGNCRHGMIPRMEQYGSQESFLRNNFTRGRFNMFMDKAVFSR